MEYSQDALAPLLQGISSYEKADQFRTWILTHAQPYQELMTYYKCALMEVETKFRVLSENLSLRYDQNPIEAIHTRIKSPESIMEKLIRRQFPLSVEGIEENINDVAGIRIVCSFLSDIYMLADALLSQDDITLIETKDYIRNPKPNGYRSLHLIVSVPIFLHNEKKPMKVEVQFRTLAMDLWASTEHKIRYKKETIITPEDSKMLLDAAAECYSIDRKLEEIHKRVIAMSAPLEEPAETE